MWRPGKAEPDSAWCCLAFRDVHLENPQTRSMPRGGVLSLEDSWVSGCGENYKALLIRERLLLLPVHMSLIHTPASRNPGAAPEPPTRRVCTSSVVLQVLSLPEELSAGGFNPMFPKIWFLSNDILPSRIGKSEQWCGIAFYNNSFLNP